MRGLLAALIVVLGTTDRALAGAPEIPPAPEPLTGKVWRNFGYKSAWVAVRSSDLGAVAAALKVRELRWEPWSEGIEQAYRGPEVAITPPIDGWILVTGIHLLLNKMPDPTHADFDRHTLGPKDRDRLAWFASLSHTLGDIQAFATYRVSEVHQWHRFSGGVNLRSVYFGDGDYLAFGEETEIERQVLQERDPGSTHPSSLRVMLVDEDDVMRIANAWSVDPSRLDEQSRRQITATHVLLGRID
jgi:hypothetical protein